MSAYRTLNDITIDSSALVSNFNYFTKLNPQAQICPVLKSNAYGHGLTQIAALVDRRIKTPYIIVDSLYEAYELSKLSIRTPILITGYTDPQNYSVWKKLPFTFTVYDLDSLRALNQYQPGAKIHLKLDTGLCRLGLQPNDLPQFLVELKKYPRLNIESIYSHLSQADDPQKSTFTQNQIKLFKKMVAQFESAGFSFKYKHIAATAGASFIRDPYFNLIRLGLGFYGYTPFGPHTAQARCHKRHLRPALTFSSRIALIKNITPGSHVGYGGSYTAKQAETIAILTAGYHEGLPRNLSNHAQFLLHRTTCPLIGNVSMNMATIKIPRTTSAKVGDPVTLISPNLKHSCNLYKLSTILDTIPYTLLTGLHSSIRRTII